MSGIDPVSPKAQAIITLLCERTSHRRTKAGVIRSTRACKTLGLAPDEMREVFAYLDLCDFNGHPYNGLTLPFPEVQA